MLMVISAEYRYVFVSMSMVISVKDIGMFFVSMVMIISARDMGMFLWTKHFYISYTYT